MEAFFNCEELPMTDIFNAIVAEDVDGKAVASLKQIGLSDLPDEPVLESTDTAYSAGDRVLVNGYGMSETFDGGYTQKQRIKPEWIVRVPESISLQEAMALGTAGYTSMLCVQGLQDGGVQPGDGPILVTGAWRLCSGTAR